MNKTIMIVCDSSIESAAMTDLLNKDYNVVAAENTMDVISFLRKKDTFLSAIILDISSADSDNLDLLKKIRQNTIYYALPVIVTTNISDAQLQEQAVADGANGFIIKPLSRRLLLYTLQNAINLRESTSPINTSRQDKLTGLLNRETFFQEAEQLLQLHPSGYYVLSCIDVDNFKLINDQYGTNVGDKVLRHIATCIGSTISQLEGISCRFSADRFALLYPYHMMDAEKMDKARENVIIPNFISRRIRIRIGRYHVCDLSLSVSTMYDRATLAQESIKGRYDVYIADYNELMRDKLLREQHIVNEMVGALRDKQFEPWFQPQYNHATGALIGAEALVRWKKGDSYILPADFIPIFESNGFIYEVDQYIWEQVCILLRSLLDCGVTPLPISVNISRRDLFHKHFISVFTGIVKKYNIPYDLLRLEVTESAFAEASGHIIARVNDLIQLGFTVEIDDFGSGYSSLNTLKDVPASILKIDMKFFENGQNNQRSGNIVESVVRMAKWLGMAVIAEGVEDREHADYLKSIGCYYIQGYYYAKPMPVSEYIALLTHARTESKLTRLETLHALNNNEFWNAKSIETLIFNSYVCGACIFEYHNGKTELLRVNEQYEIEIGHFFSGNAMSPDASPFNFLDSKNHDKLLQSITKTIETQKECVCEIKLSDSSGFEAYFSLRLRVIAHTGERYMFYCGFVNMTQQREAERKQLESSQQLEFIMSNINGGVSAISINDDGTSKLIFNNDKYFELYGYTREQAEAINLDVMQTIVPEDLPYVMEKVKAIKATKKPAIIDYRCIKQDGRLAYLRANASLMNMAAYGDVITSVVTDITETMALEDRLSAIINNIDGGITATVIKNGKPEFIVINERFFKMLGYETFEQYDADRPNKYMGIHPDDRERIIKQFTTSDGGKKHFTMEYRIIRKDGEIRYIHNNVSIVSLFGVDEPVRLSVASDITQLRLTQQKEIESAAKLNAVLSHAGNGITAIALHGNSPQFLFANDKYFQIVGHTRKAYEKATKDDMFAIVHKDDRERVRLAVTTLNRLRSSLTLEYRVIHSDGKVSLVNSVITITKLDGYDVPVQIAVFSDITMQREKESQLELLTSSIPCGLASFTCTKEDVRLDYYNEGFCSLFGYTKNDFPVPAPLLMDMICSEDRPVIDAQISALLDGDTHLDCIYRIISKDGKCKWINHNARVFERSNGCVKVTAVLLDVTQQQEEKERLRISAELNRLAIKLSGNIITKFDVQSKTLTLPDILNPIFTMPHVLKNVPQAQIDQGNISPDTADTCTKIFEDITNGESAGIALFKHISSKGWRWLEAQFTTVFSNTHKPISAVISFSDVTERLEKEVVYNKWQQSLSERAQDSYTLFRCNLSKGAAFDSREGGLLQICFDDSSQTFDQRTMDYAEKYVYKEDYSKYISFMNSDRLLAEYYRGHRSDTLEYREINENTGVRWLLLTVDLVEYPSSSDVEVYIMYEDIDRQKKEQLLTLQRSETDPLTGILNRSTFISRMEDILSTSSPTTLHALFLLDIDDFKQINDTLGHGAGDQVLRDLTRNIGSILRKNDLVGRLGGDEFFIFLNDIPDVELAAKKAQEICSMKISAHGETTNVTASIGIAIIPTDGKSFDSLYKKVDHALYRQKKLGKNGFLFVEQ